MTIRINYIKTKRNLKKEVEQYILRYMVIFKQVQVKHDKDFKLYLPAERHPPNTEDLSFIESFNEIINKLSREEREIFIRSILNKESDIKIGDILGFSEFTIRDKRKEVIKLVAVSLGCACFERGG